MSHTSFNKKGLKHIKHTVPFENQELRIISELIYLTLSDSEVNANRTPQVASRPLHAEDILSVPPSYHTDEEHRRGHHRLPMFDKQGYLGAFALENAFERRLRNTIQGRRPRVQRDGIASFSSRFRGVPTPFVSNYQTNDKRLSSYPEHRVHFYNEHQLERNEIPRAHGTSHLNRNSVRQEVNGVTRFWFTYIFTVVDDGFFFLIYIPTAYFLQNGHQVISKQMVVLNKLYCYQWQLDWYQCYAR